MFQYVTLSSNLDKFKFKIKLTVKSFMIDSCMWVYNLRKMLQWIIKMRVVSIHLYSYFDQDRALKAYVKMTDMLTEFTGTFTFYKRGDEWTTGEAHIPLSYLLHSASSFSTINVKKGDQITPTLWEMEFI